MDESTDQIRNLVTEGQALLEQARGETSGRSSASLVHEDSVRAVLMGLTAGTGLAEHDPPAGATLHIVTGRARLFVADEGGQEWLLGDGDHVAIPHARHGVDALSDTILLLTVAL
ncbi:MAG: LuxR family transcriptional regulator [Dermatophilaceae bacterium]|nr:LuxR family transcriptional regulator [Intrasporangiaceae bacterium]